MNDSDILAIAVERARRDTGYPWDMPGIMKQVKTVLDLQCGFAATLCAAVRAAANPNNRTPAILAKPGEHWRSDDTPREAPQPPRFVRGVDDRDRLDPDVAQRGAAACRAELGDNGTTVRHRQQTIAELARRLRLIAPTLTDDERRQLRRHLVAQNAEAAS